MFQASDTDLYLAGGPDIEAWYVFFKEIVDHIAESRLVAFARHVCPHLLDGAVYPLRTDVDPQFISGLEVPGGARMGYDDIFDMGVGHVVRAWTAVSADVLTGSRGAGAVLRNWNLDTGEERPGVMTFWS